MRATLTSLTKNSNGRVILIELSHSDFRDTWINFTFMCVHIHVCIMNIYIVYVFCEVKYFVRILSHLSDSSHYWFRLSWFHGGFSRYLRMSPWMSLRALFARVGFASTSHPLWRILEEIYLSTWKIEEPRRASERRQDWTCRSVLKVTGRHESMRLKRQRRTDRTRTANRRYNGSRIHERVMR